MIVIVIVIVIAELAAAFEVMFSSFSFSSLSVI